MGYFDGRLRNCRSSPIAGLAWEHHAEPETNTQLEKSVLHESASLPRIPGGSRANRLLTHPDGPASTSELPTIRGAFGEYGIESDNRIFQKVEEDSESLLTSTRADHVESMKEAKVAMRKSVSSGSPFEPRIGFSRAVRVGQIVAVSGTAPIALNA